MLSFRFLYLAFCTVVCRADPPYEPTWASLDSRPNPAWYEEARFGIKIHWGPYSVPGYGALGQYAEQYRRFYRVGTADCGSEQNPISGGCDTALFHSRAYGNKTYEELFMHGGFNPVMYNASLWADVFRRGGAQYVYMTAKHSDGFALWPAKTRPKTNSMATIGRDLFGELMSAVEDAGLKKGIFYEIEDYFQFGCSYNINASGQALHNTRCPWGGSDEGFPAGFAEQYVNNTLIPELRDLVMRYKPHYLYADGDWSGSDDFLKTKPFLAWLFNDSPVKDFVVINDRWGNTTRTNHGGTYMCEYDPTCKFAGHAFAVTQGFGKSFGYNRNEEVSVGTTKWCDWNLEYGDGRCRVSSATTYADAAECCTHTNTTGLVHLLVRTVAKGGNLEINFGPTGDGRLPESMTTPLLGTGRWLQTNGEAVYGTKGFPFGADIAECSADTPDDRRIDKCYTVKGDTVYVIYLRFPPRAHPTKPDHRLIHLDHLVPSALSKVTLVGSNVSLPYVYMPSGVAAGFEVAVPELAPDELGCNVDLCHALVFKVTAVKLPTSAVMI